MKIIDHWLDTARKVPSPNYDDRPPETEISLIVIHCISLPPGEFGGPWIDKLFTNTLSPFTHLYFKTIHRLKLSAHVLIRRTGEIVQYVPFDKRAWHAGVSCYQGKSACNDFSVGIELEGTGQTSYTDPQYLQLARLIEVLLGAYPGLGRERITEHSDIAPGRKEDPGPSFDRRRLHALLDSFEVKI